MLPWRLQNQRNYVWLLLIRLLTLIIVAHAAIILWVFFLYQTLSLKFVCSSHLKASVRPGITKSETIVGLVSKKTVTKHASVSKPVQPPKKVSPDIKKTKKNEKKIVDPPKLVQKQEVKPVKIEQKIEKNSEKIEKKQEIPEKKVQSVPIAEQQAQPIIADEQEPTEKKYISARERDEQQRVSLLQQTISAQWHPPIGLDKAYSCTVTFYVGKQGLAEKIKITQPSGSLLFDMSVRATLKTMPLPLWAQGKMLTITFKE